MWSYARPFCEEADDDPPQYFQGRALPLSRLVVAILALRVLFRVCRPCVMAKQQPQRRARRLAAHLAFQMWFLATDLLARKCLCLADEGGWLGLGRAASLQHLGSPAIRSSFSCVRSETLMNTCQYIRIYIYIYIYIYIFFNMHTYIHTYIHHTTVHYITVRYSTVQCSAVQHIELQCIRTYTDVHIHTYTRCTY